MVCTTVEVHEYDRHTDKPLPIIDSAGRSREIRLLLEEERSVLRLLYRALVDTERCLEGGVPPKVPTGRSRAMQAQCNMMQQKMQQIQHNEKALPKINALSTGRNYWINKRISILYNHTN